MFRGEHRNILPTGRLNEVSRIEQEEEEEEVGVGVGAGRGGASVRRKQQAGNTVNECAVLTTLFHMLPCKLTCHVRVIHLNRFFRVGVDDGYVKQMSSVVFSFLASFLASFSSFVRVEMAETTATSKLAIKLNEELIACLINAMRMGTRMDG